MNFEIVSENALGFPDTDSVSAGYDTVEGAATAGDAVSARESTTATPSPASEFRMTIITTRTRTDWSKLRWRYGLTCGGST